MQCYFKITLDPLWLVIWPPQFLAHPERAILIIIFGPFFLGRCIQIPLGTMYVVNNFIKYWTFVHIRYRSWYYILSNLWNNNFSGIAKIWEFKVAFKMVLIALWVRSRMTFTRIHSVSIWSTRCYIHSLFDRNMILPDRQLQSAPKKGRMLAMFELFWNWDGF